MSDENWPPQPIHCYVIRLLRLGHGPSTNLTGKLLKDADFEAHGGRGAFSVTDELIDARMFETRLDALEFWKTQSKTCPLRDDGRPNCPMTSYTVEILTVTMTWDLSREKERSEAEFGENKNDRQTFVSEPGWLRNDQLNPELVIKMPLDEFLYRFEFTPVDALEKWCFAVNARRITSIQREMFAAGLLDYPDLDSVVMK